jgi:type I restriction-modification system DNA methylase subunit
MEKTTRKTILMPNELIDWIAEQANKNRRCWSAEAIILIELAQKKLAEDAEKEAAA